MTQEQRINRGTIIIFILSIILLVCLCATATLAYFAGGQSAETTLILGGPVRVSMVNRDFEQTYGDGQLVMNINADRDTLLPGMGIDMQAIAKITSDDDFPTSALLRAILTVNVVGVNEKLAKEIEYQIREAMSKQLKRRIDGEQDGWVLFDDGNYYFCDKDKAVDPNTGEEYVIVKTLEGATEELGKHVTFINGTFQFPYKSYTNKYSDVDITFNLKFQAIQKQLSDENGVLTNTIFNVKQVLDNLDWSIHNN